jgi:hypothetical protein
VRLSVVFDLQHAKNAEVPDLKRKERRIDFEPRTESGWGVHLHSVLREPMEAVRVRLGGERARQIIRQYAQEVSARPRPPRWTNAFLNVVVLPVPGQATITRLGCGELTIASVAASRSAASGSGGPPASLIFACTVAGRSHAARFYPLGPRYDFGVTQAKKFAELRRDWEAKGSPPCDHPSRDKEYDLGADAGDRGCL